MANDEGGEKTEKPTPRRREKAREEGQVPLSQEIGVAVAVLVLSISIYYLIPFAVAEYVETLGESLTIDFDRYLSSSRAISVVQQASWSLFLIFGPVAFLALVFGTLGSLLQIGIYINWGNIGPKWTRLSPMNWIKKVASVELIFNLTKSILKGIGVVIVAVLGLLDLPGDLWRLAGTHPALLALEIRDIAFSLSARVFCALLILALLDVIWTRWRFEQRLMMSRQEVKDELKDMEGNPHVRSAIRKRMNEFSNRNLRDAMSEATVVTTNPTHYAVALRYWQGRDDSPVVVAKGLDYKAKRIRMFAEDLDVPIVEDKPLARALYSLVEEGNHVPVELYRSVAKILAIVYRRRRSLSWENKE